MTYYQCIGFGRPWSPSYHVEPKYADGRLWIVPGTYPDDPATDQAKVKAEYRIAPWFWR